MSVIRTQTCHFIGGPLDGAERFMPAVEIYYVAEGPESIRLVVDEDGIASLDRLETAVYTLDGDEYHYQGRLQRGDSA